jgi:hypothetical protein
MLGTIIDFETNQITFTLQCFPLFAFKNQVILSSFSSKIVYVLNMRMRVLVSQKIVRLFSLILTDFTFHLLLYLFDFLVRCEFLEF